MKKIIAVLLAIVIAFNVFAFAGLNIKASAAAIVDDLIYAILLVIASAGTGVFSQLATQAAFGVDWSQVADDNQHNLVDTVNSNAIKNVNCLH